MKRILLLAALLVQQQAKPYRLPSTDLKQPVIWGSACEVPDGPSLAFGGVDQKAEDGNPHTRIKVDGAWKAIHEELRAKNPNLAARDEAWRRRNGVKKQLAEMRFGYLEARETNMAVTPAHLRALFEEQIRLEKGAEALDAEPPPRALSPVAYDAKTRLFVVFGGDHLDYLTNDTWTFDPEKKAWTQRHPKEAPPPRANHALKAADGKVVLTGGYTYTSSTDYVGGQYRDLNDGEWTYDIAADVWASPAKGVASDSRVYRTGRLHPDHYVQDPKPDAAAFSKFLEDVPANSWTMTKPPQLPALNRDWGTAVLDPDRDLILRWSGGHSAHGGTDVLQYHLNTNRWELCYPVEFPLGQLYSNTEYPEGVSFNRRPWVTGHTYQNYGYDPNLRMMLFTGRQEDCHVYDPGTGDWSRRFAKPKGMVYGGCFYTLTCAPTPEGLVCWTQEGRLFQVAGGEWVERQLSGEKLPGSIVDNSTLVYDSKRERLLFARKPYGDKASFTGELYAVDVKTWAVSALSPGGKEAAAAIPYLCQIRYDAGNDLLLVGATLAPDADGARRTPAYDPQQNRWVSLKIGGTDPSGKTGRNVSLGLMYDAKRKVFWAVDTNSQVYVLRLDSRSADPHPLKKE